MLDWESPAEMEKGGKATPSGATPQQNWLGTSLKTVVDLWLLAEATISAQAEYRSPHRQPPKQDAIYMDCKMGSELLLKSAVTSCW